MSNPWKVVIVGGGFGGLYAAQQLKSDRMDVTLIDGRNYHLFQPLLYQVATGSLATHRLIPLILPADFAVLARTGTRLICPVAGTEAEVGECTGR